MKKRLFPIISSLYLLAIFGLPSAAASLLATVQGGVWRRAAAGMMAAPAFVVLLAAIAGSLSVLHQKGVVQGTFPRSLDHPTYFHRRLYGLCWTSLYYFKPVYYLCLGIPWLRALTFRLFGYRGNLDFTLYPDTWIRDLPLLELGKGAYVSSRATLGTNIVLSNGRILVDRIVVGERAQVGHLAMLAPGVRLGAGAEIGVGCGIGIGATIGDRAWVGPMGTVEHGVTIGARARIGIRSYIGARAWVGEGLTLPAGSSVAARAAVRHREEAACAR